MNYENKYNELIKRIKDLQFAYRFSPIADVISESFPEIYINEDEKIKKETILFLENKKANEKNSLKPNTESRLKAISKLIELINNQNNWKPTKEQLDTIYLYSEQNNKIGTFFRELYQDLKKL